MKLNVVDKAGKKVSDLTVNSDVFGVTPNNTVLQQYIRVFRANQRQGTSKVKDRSEVSGGGRKPWRQKGTGRARAGSSRSPLWRGGGIVHGPAPKSWNLSFPKNLKSLAFRSAISYQVKNSKVIVLDKFSQKEPNTKALVNLLAKLGIDRQVLLITKDAEPVLVKSAANMPNLQVSFAGNVNTYEVLHAHNLVLLQDAVVALEEKYKK